MKLRPVFNPLEPDISAVRPYLEKALRHTKDWTIEDTYAAIRTKAVLLMRCEDDTHHLVGAGVVSVDLYPARNLLTVHLFSADTGSDWQAVLGDLRAFGRGMNCSAVRGYGRKGWARKLHAKPLHGWEVDA